MVPHAIRTTVVGSYPVPEWLRLSPNEETLADATVVAMRAQERAGVEVISDGELGRWDLRRNAPGGMVERFVRPMAGVSTEPTRAQLEAFRARADTAYRRDPPGVVIGPVGEGTLDLGRELDRALALTDRPLKLTLTSPYMMAKVLADEHYHDARALALALARVLADQVAGIAGRAAVVQVDEPNLPGAPQDAALAAEAINAVLDAVPAATDRTGPGAARALARPQRAVHLCFGNYGGQTIQRGHYARLIGFINALRCDHVVLETTRRPAKEIDALRGVRPEVALGLGVIDVKDLQVETAEAVAARLKRLSRTVGAERIAWVHPDCGLRNLPRAVADAKLRALVAGRDLFEGARGRGGID